MKIIAVLFLSICLSLSPSITDTTKYTIEHNNDILENLNKDLFSFISSLEKLENNRLNKINTLKGIVDIILKYECEGELYIIARGEFIKIIDKKLSKLLIVIDIMNSLGDVDRVSIIYDIAAVKKGIPVKIQSDRVKT